MYFLCNGVFACAFLSRLTSGFSAALPLASPLPRLASCLASCLASDIGSVRPSDLDAGLASGLASALALSPLPLTPCPQALPSRVALHKMPEPRFATRRYLVGV
jgi:hypothetical protein